MSYLLDVNVLIGLLDENHPFHQPASTWFHGGGNEAWATCPITENGVVRVMSNSRYPNRPGQPQNVLALLAELCLSGNHSFWPDEISLSNDTVFDLRTVHQSDAVTDVYLLGLAKIKGGKLATFDRGIKTNAVIDGIDALHQLKA